MNTARAPRSIFLFVVLACLLYSYGASARTIPGAAPKIRYPKTAARFYGQVNNTAFWHANAESFGSMQRCLLSALDTCAMAGLNKENYHYAEILLMAPATDSTAQALQDRLFTDALISYSNDLLRGADVNKWLSNDEVSGKYAATDETRLLSDLGAIKTAVGLWEYLQALEPSEHDYVVLKSELRKQMASGSQIRVRQLREALDVYRLIHHFRFSRHIVVNIPSATLRYFSNDTPALQMKVVVGKPSTRSPRFATWCYEVVLYPYWNVPQSIARKELLPRIKRNPALLTSMQLQVMTASGKQVAPETIDWTKYNRSNFPYTLRQCTGCDNSLGVIKFNLTDPFNVYLHDTNYKLAFLSASRFMSHGCIRVEKPIELGNAILNGKLDSTFLKACLKGQEPTRINVGEQVPVFIVYSIPEASGDSVIYNKDIYHLYRGR